MNEQRFEYFAFISYNHQDRQYAEKLQKQLQRYRLPSTFVAEHPDHPKHVSPVFLDQTDLLAHEGPLALSLQAQLEASNYLIVLCSPNSASSPWVNAEVEYFISRGRKDRIVPVILAGTPHAQDPAQECYPPALASLPAEEELLGISVADYGWRGAFLRVLATILHLKMDTVIRRDAAYRRRKLILAAGLALAAAIGVFALVWHNTPHTAYYRSIVTRWAAPEGISPVSAAERSSLSSSWKLTTLRGQVIQAEYVNSADRLTEDVTMLSSEPPMVHIVYDSEGKVSRKEYFDLYSRPLYTLQYSGNLRIADFVSSDSGNAVALASDSISVLSPEDSLKERTDIIRYVCTYDEQTGLEISRTYKRDNRGSDGGTSVANAAGVWGKRFEYDEKGRLLRDWNLGRNGDIIASSGGYAGLEYAYDALDRIVTVTRLAPDGQPMFSGSDCMTKIRWNEAGQPDWLGYFAFTDEDSLQFVLCNQFDGQGFRTCMQAFTGSGAVYYVVEGADAVRFEYDSLGRMTRRICCGPQGEPVPCADGYAWKTFQRNEAGQITEELSFAADGSPAVDLAGGAYGTRLYYDGNGLMVRQENLGQDGTLMSIPDGYAIVEQSFNAERQVESIRAFDENGDPTLILGGYAALLNTYEDGHVVSVRCLDTDGNVLTLSSGYAWIKRSYTNGLLTESALFDPEGAPATGSEGWHRHCYRYNEYSQISEEWFEGLNGLPVDAPLGYARRQLSYDDQGRLTGEKYLKSDGSEALLKDLFYASRHTMEYGVFGVVAEEYLTDSPRDLSLPSRNEKTYDSRGLVVSECWMNAEGAPVPNLAGNVRIDYEADQARRLTKIAALQGDGTLVLSERVYDDSGRICETRLSNSQISFTVRYDFDDFGRTRSEVTEGYLTFSPDQLEYSREDYTYDLYSRISDIRYYGRDRQPVMHDDTCAHRHNTYDSFGRIIAEENYDTEDQPCEVSGWFRTEYSYDRYGSLTGTVRLLTDGSKAPDKLYLILVTGIADGSWAESVSMPLYSYILQFGEWHFSQIQKSPDAWQAALDNEIQHGRRDDPSIPLVTMEPAGDNTSYVFETRTIPTGYLGIIYTPIEIDASLFDTVLDYWDQYLAYVEDNGID